MSKKEESRHYRAKYPERKAAENRKYWEKNRVLKAQYRRNRKARIRGASGSHTNEDILEILRLQRGRCAYCRARISTDYHVDHIIAVSCGGTNDRTNLQLTCASCNRSKYTRNPIEFAQSLGRLI